MRATWAILCVGLGCGGTAPPPDAPHAPAQPGAMKFVPPTAVEGKRVSGNNAIEPDDLDKAKLAEEAKGREARAAGSFQLCLDKLGQVASVTMTRTTGIPNYDRKIIRTIETTWRYSPFLIDGFPHPICTTVSFIYRQSPVPKQH